MPDVGVHATLKRLRAPRTADGFDRLYAVRLGAAGAFTVTAIDDEGPPSTGERP